MAYRLAYHPQVKTEDLCYIPQNIKDRIQKAIEIRLTIEPLTYGEPLRRGLYGYRKLRVGDWRVIYKVDKGLAVILKIGNRKNAYDRAHLRIPAG